MWKVERHDVAEHLAQKGVRQGGSGCSGEQAAQLAPASLRQPAARSGSLVSIV